MARPDYFEHVANVLKLEARYKLARVVAALSDSVEMCEVERARLRKQYANPTRRRSLFLAVEKVAAIAYRSMQSVYVALMECFTPEYEPAVCVAEGYKMLARGSINEALLESGYRH